MTTTVTSNVRIQDLFNDALSAIQSKGENVRAGMQDIKDEKGNIDTEKMLQMQFEIGTYNTLLETASTVTKSLTDEAKQIAQRSS